MGTELDDKIINDLLLTKAMENSIGKLDRWGSLNDIVDEMFANGAIDRDDYFASLVELTQLGYIKSSLKTTEDIKISERKGYDIDSVTKKGIEYINKMENQEKIKKFFAEFDKMCLKISQSGTFQLGIGLASILALLV